MSHLTSITGHSCHWRGWIHTQVRDPTLSPRGRSTTSARRGADDVTTSTASVADRKDGAMSPPSGELADATTALHDQWDRLRRWVGDVVDDHVADEPSVLDGWTVAELVAHLGRAMDALAVCVPLPDGTVPLTLGEYVGTYAERAAGIAQVTRELAVEIADDPLGAVDQRAQAAFDAARRAGPDGPRRAGAPRARCCSAR